MFITKIIVGHHCDLTLSIHGLWIYNTILKEELNNQNQFGLVQWAEQGF